MVAKLGLAVIIGMVAGMVAAIGEAVPSVAAATQMVDDVTVVARVEAAWRVFGHQR